MDNTNDWREDRLRAISINALRESRVAYERDQHPWTDDDAKRLDMIFRILHIVEAKDVDTTREHFGIIAAHNPPASPALAAVAKALAQLPEENEEILPLKIRK